MEKLVLHLYPGGSEGNALRRALLPSPGECVQLQLSGRLGFIV